MVRTALSGSITPAFRVPQNLDVDRDLRPPRAGFFAAHEFVFNALGLEYGSQGLGITSDTEVEGAGLNDQICFPRRAPARPTLPGLYGQTCVKGVKVGIAEDARRTVRAAVIGGRSRTLNDRHLITPKGQTPGSRSSC
jgi:hypothetical protein